jgi:hypothetical protein
VDLVEAVGFGVGLLVADSALGESIKVKRMAPTIMRFIDLTI